MEQLICENITKNYKSKDVLDSVNLTLAKGKIYGLIGRNGAGKTTLLSILSAQNPRVRAASFWKRRRAGFPSGKMKRL